MGLLQRADAERRVAGLGEFPVGKEFVAVNVHPDAEHAEFGFGEVPREHFAGVDGHGNFMVLIPRVDMGRVVVVVIPVIEENQDSVEHGNGGHWGCPFVVGTSLTGAKKGRKRFFGGARGWNAE